MWVKSHVDKELFEGLFCDESEWTDQHADIAAGARVKWLDKQAAQAAYRDISRLADQKSFRIQQHQLPHVTGNLAAIPYQAKPFGPRSATRQQFLDSRTSTDHTSLASF